MVEGDDGCGVNGKEMVLRESTDGLVITATIKSFSLNNQKCFYSVF
jgi:hypothetical protein